MNKRGEILIENVIFIILNLVFLSILVVFLMQQGSGEAIIEQAYSKQLALLVDSARPGEIIEINMKDSLKAVKKNGYQFDKVVSFNDSLATIQLSSKGGYSYHYFNDVNVNSYPATDSDGEYSGRYVIIVTEK